MRYEIGELTIGSILDQGISLMKNHFALLFGITAVMLIPLSLVINLTIAGFDPTMLPHDPKNMTPEEIREMVTFGAGLAALVFLNLLVVYPLTYAAILHALACEYLDKPISIGGAYRRAIRTVLPLLGTVILGYLAALPGFCCCYVPGIVLMLLLSLATPIVVIEGIYFVPALKRSWGLMKGNLLTAFVLWLILVAIQGAIGASGNLIPQKQIAGIVGAMLAAIGFVIHSAVWVVFYFSCRSKAENFDLTMLADTVGIDDPDLPQSDFEH